MSSVLPRVSVVIPVYNGERYIRQALISVLRQTHAQIECLVVDDGSVDGTASAVDATADGRVRYVYQANAGVSAARNTGLAAASGDYIAFLDADDVWLPSKLERQLHLAAERPDAGLIYCGYTITDQRLRPVAQVRPDMRDARLKKWLMLEGNGIGLSFTGMVPRPVADAVGGFNTGLSTSADLEWSCRVANNWPVVAVPAALALYRNHGEQMHRDMIAFERDMIRVLHEMRGASLGHSDHRRALANLHTRLFFAAVASRQSATAKRHLRAAASTDPTRLAMLPLGAAHRRLARRLAVLRSDPVPHLGLTTAQVPPP